MRDVIKKFPKLRGHGKNRARTVNSSKADVRALNLGTIDEAFKAGEKVTVETLILKGLAEKSSGRMPHVKILAAGEVTKKLSFIGLPVSAQAKAKIEQAGGSVK
jgi:large subunit ribosomal protein L15